MGFGFGHASDLHGVHERHQEHKPHDYGPLQGALVVMAGSGLFVALAFGAMMALTGPNGWITRAVSSTIAGDAGTVLVSYTAEEQH